MGRVSRDTLEKLDVMRIVFFLLLACSSSYFFFGFLLDIFPAADTAVVLDVSKAQLVYIVNTFNSSDGAMAFFVPQFYVEKGRRSMSDKHVNAHYIGLRVRDSRTSRHHVGVWLIAGNLEKPQALTPCNFFAYYLSGVSRDKNRDEICLYNDFQVLVLTDLLEKSDGFD